MKNIKLDRAVFVDAVNVNGAQHPSLVSNAGVTLTGTPTGVEVRVGSRHWLIPWSNVRQVEWTE